VKAHPRLIYSTNWSCNFFYFCFCQLTMFTWNFTTGLCSPTSCQNCSIEVALGQEQ